MYVSHFKLKLKQEPELNLLQEIQNKVNSLTILNKKEDPISISSLYDDVIFSVFSYLTKEEIYKKNSKKSISKKIGKF